MLWDGTAVVTPFPSKVQHNLHFGFGAQVSAVIKCVGFFVPPELNKQITLITKTVLWWW